MATNYTGVDLDRYNAGNKFLSQDPYLQNYQNKAAITFNPSQSNTGIMSQYPYPYPIIPQEGGDGVIDPRRPGYGYKSQFNPVTQNKEFQDDIGVGTITKEEEEFAKAQELKRGLLTIGKFGLMTMSPFGPINTYGIGEGIGFGINKVKDFFGNDGGSDEININKDGTFTKESIDQSFAGEEGPTSGSTMSSQDEMNAGGRGSRMAYGGRAGYRDGGLTEYEVFKLGELGYNTKGGTVLEPFGGIKVLKNILRVNKYADGGRAGYRDGGYSLEDNEEQQAQDQASFDAGNRSDDYNDMYSGDSNTPNNNIDIPTGTSNLDFNLRNYTDPTVSYSNNFGRFGGMLDTTRTLQEEEPVGTMGYFSPSGNFGIGYDTDKGIVSNANLGNFNLGYTGTGGTNLNYMGGFAGDAGRFGANYGKNGLEARMTYNKKFNNGGIVGMYR